MRCFWALALMVATTGFMAGCNNCDSCSAPNNKEKGNQESPEKQKENPQEGTQTQASTPIPQQVTEAFLEAAKQGNTQQATMCLTSTARTALPRENLDIVRTVSNGLTGYEIQQTICDGQTAAVVSLLTRKADSNAQPNKMKMVWLLRTTEEGWRISQACMYLRIDDQESYPLNFENPKEIRQTYDAIDAKREQLSNTQKDKTILR